MSDEFSGYSVRLHPAADNKINSTEHIKLVTAQPAGCVGNWSTSNLWCAYIARAAVHEAHGEVPEAKSWLQDGCILAAEREATDDMVRGVWQACRNAATRRKDLP